MPFYCVQVQIIFSKIQFRIQSFTRVGISTSWEKFCLSKVSIKILYFRLVSFAEENTRSVAIRFGLTFYTTAVQFKSRDCSKRCVRPIAGGGRSMMFANLCGAWAIVALSRNEQWKGSRFLEAREKVTTVYLLGKRWCERPCPENGRRTPGEPMHIIHG